VGGEITGCLKPIAEIPLSAAAILITHDLRLVDGADQVLVLGETTPGRWSVPAAPVMRWSVSRRS
jgi:hypothetical protein